MTSDLPSIDFTRVVFSESSKELLAAFVKFSADITNVAKNAANPFFSSSYADLGAAINSSREHLAKHELAVMQHPFTLGDLIGVNTILCHSSGQSVSSTLLLKPVKTDPQALGSAITYARRYAYMAVLGMAAQDDDGNAASGKQQQGESQGQAKGKPQDRNQGQQQGIRKPEQERSKEVIPPKSENFDQENPDHLERLEKQLARFPEVSTNQYLDIASILHGKPMTSATLQAAVEALSGAL